MSKSKIGSPEWEKDKLKIARIHGRIYCRMREFLHKVSMDRVDGRFAIALERLAPKPMNERSSGRSMYKRYTEASWWTLIAMLEYKVEGVGIWLTFVNPRDTSCPCLRCGSVVAELSLSEKTHRYRYCGLVMDK